MLLEQLEVVLCAGGRQPELQVVPHGESWTQRNPGVAREVESDVGWSENEYYLLEHLCRRTARERAARESSKQPAEGFSCEC